MATAPYYYPNRSDDYAANFPAQAPSNSILDFFGSIGDTIEGAATSLANAYSGYLDLRTSTRIQKDRNAAIERIYASAPDAVKITAPSTSDALENQETYARSLAQTLGGAVASKEGGNLALLAAGVVALILLSKGK